MSFVEPAITAAGRRQRQRAYARHYGTTPLADSVANILAVFMRAEDENVAYEEGIGWYHAAHAIAAEHAATYGTTVSQAAGVIAALSPQTGWAENIRLAGEFWRRHAQRRTDLMSGHTTDAIVKCQRIGRGEDPYLVLGGRKVRSFYANILRPDTPGPVTIDRHAIAVIMARPLPASDPDARSPERPGVYTRAAGAYRTVARMVGLHPHQVQAVVWCQWRRETGADQWSSLPDGTTPF